MYIDLNRKMKQTDIKEFLLLAGQYPVLDVRSPGEYMHAHIPGGYNLPLFSDEERKVVGTAYKQEGREQAIKIGLEYFGVKMRKMVEEVEGIVLKIKKEKSRPASLVVGNGDKNIVLVHCWRGGMRSAGVAWLLDLYGFEVYVLIGGYKSFRNWVLEQFEQDYRIKLLGGYTGSGKTEILKQLRAEGELVIDLEGIAHHKGSAFGGLGQPEQPSQEMFENELGIQLHNVSGNVSGQGFIWLEDESSRIGSVNLPPAFWKTMLGASVFFLDIPFEERLNYIVEEYGKFEKKELINSIIRIRKRLGGQRTKDAIGHILDGDIKEGLKILLSYYDKYYARGLEERKRPVTMVACERVAMQTNIRRLTGKK